MECPLTLERQRATRRGATAPSYELGVVTSRSGDIFAGIGNLAYDAGPLVIGFPDVFAGLNGARVVMDYAGTSEGAAVAWKDDPDGSGAIVLGFPLTMISNAASRTQLLDASIDYLLRQAETDDLWMIR